MRTDDLGEASVPRALLRDRMVGASEPHWERWSPDTAGRRRLRTWRRPHRLWVDVDLGDARVPDAMVDRVLDALAPASAHTALVATQEPARLARRAAAFVFRHALDGLAGDGSLPAQVCPTVVVRDAVALLGAGELLLVPAATRAVVVPDGPVVPVADLARWLGPDQINRLLVDAAVGRVLPGWLAELQAACAAAGAALELVETPPWSPWSPWSARGRVP